MERLGQWTAWIPLEGAWLGDRLPAEGGLYRIRRSGLDRIDYIGQTGTGTMTLRKRMGMLRGVFAEAMPLCDPHVAGPALWALRQAQGVQLEVSSLPMPGASVVWRKSWECLAISRYRVAIGQSPTANFGRMPEGFIRSSHNNGRLQAAGLVLRGAFKPGFQADYHLPGIPPQSPLDQDCQGAGWCGHAWSPWVSGSEWRGMGPADGTGLYRIRRRGQEGLVYVGEGRIRTRVLAHLGRARQDGHPQQSAFSDAAGLEISWVCSGVWLPHQRLELENDLIAAHVMGFEAAPVAQFVG